MQCEMCGRDTKLFCTQIESTVLKVCQNCAKYGKVISPVSAAQPKIVQLKKEQPQNPPEPEYAIVPDYAVRIKSKREQLGWKQEELAKKLNEKISILHKIETGHLEPTLEVARKIEKLLEIKLVTEYKESVGNVPKARPSDLTIGDFIDVK